MNELLTNLLIAVITAAIPVLTTFIVKYISKARDKAIASTDNAKNEWYIQEIAAAISDAVSATSQTYVDALKKAGTFGIEAQKQAATKALNACLAAISPTAKSFIEEMYGDVTAYLSTKIEAEVRAQKSAPVALEAVTLESSADTTAIAASTAAATAATIAQTAISQIGAEPAVQEQ